MIISGWIKLPKPDKDGYIWIDNTTCIKADLYEKTIKDFIKKSNSKIKIWEETSGTE